MPLSSWPVPSYCSTPTTTRCRCKPCPPTPPWCCSFGTKAPAWPASPSSYFSSTGPTCTCADHAQGYRCKHIALIDLVGRLERAETDAEQGDQEIPCALTPRALAVLDPDAACTACDCPARWHDGPTGQCTRNGCDAEGWWACDCQGFQVDAAA